ncbi:MAG: hypothetical protein AAF798_17575 [Bacteroidota bacterium]
MKSLSFFLIGGLFGSLLFFYASQTNSLKKQLGNMQVELDSSIQQTDYYKEQSKTLGFALDSVGHVKDALAIELEDAKMIIAEDAIIIDSLDQLSRNQRADFELARRNMRLTYEKLLKEQGRKIREFRRKEMRRSQQKKSSILKSKLEWKAWFSFDASSTSPSEAVRRAPIFLLGLLGVILFAFAAAFGGAIILGILHKRKSYRL